MKAPEGVQSLAGGIGGKIVRARANVMALCTDTCTHTHTPKVIAPESEYIPV